MTFSKSGNSRRRFNVITLASLAVLLCPIATYAQNGKAETVSVSPYARQSNKNVLHLPANYKPPVKTVASKTGSLPSQPQHVLIPPRGSMPPTPTLTPASVPKPPPPVVANDKPADMPKELAKPAKNISITDVIDNVIKAAPDRPQDTAVASVQPADKIKTPSADDKPALLSVAAPGTVGTAEPAPVTGGKAHQPSRQDIAKLGDDKPRFYWPLRGNVFSTFGTKGSGKKNDGLNISAPKGTAVRSAASGLVVYSGQDLGGLGNLILIRHSGGYHTAYAHVDNVLVKTGDKVSAGEAIANVGKTGNVTKPQLHFEIRDGTKPVDPEGYLPQA